MLFRFREGGVICTPVSPSEGGVAYMLVSHREGGVACGHVSISEEGMAFVPVSHSKAAFVLLNRNIQS